MKLHPSRKRPRFYSLSNQMTQFNTNSRVIVSRVDVSEDVSLSSVRRVLLKMPNAWRESCMSDTSRTAGKGLEQRFQVR